MWGLEVALLHGDAYPHKVTEYFDPDAASPNLSRDAAIFGHAGRSNKCEPTLGGNVGSLTSPEGAGFEGARDPGPETHTFSSYVAAARRISYRYPPYLFPSALDAATDGLFLSGRSDSQRIGAAAD
jgi:hypothetical protein